MYDPNAIAIYQDKHVVKKVAYLSREDAKVIKELFDMIYAMCYLRAKTAPEKFNRRKGPMQNVSIGFLASDSRVEDIKQFCLSNKLYFKIF